MKCTNCNGKGKIMWETWIKKIRGFEIEFEICPKCKGTGIEEVKKMNKCEWIDGEFKGCDKYTYMSEEFKYCPFCGVSLEKPVKIEVGMFGKFFDDDESAYLYGELNEVFKDVPYAYMCDRGAIWKNFTPVLPTDIYNQDGTKK